MKRATMTINLCNRARPSISTNMKVGLNKRTLLFKIRAFVILLVGYFLTTGTKMIESDGVKNAFRIIALFFSW